MLRAVPYYAAALAPLFVPLPVRAQAGRPGRGAAQQTEQPHDFRRASFSTMRRFCEVAAPASPAARYSATLGGFGTYDPRRHTGIGAGANSCAAFRCGAGSAAQPAVARTAATATANRRAT